MTTDEVKLVGARRERVENLWVPGATRYDLTAIWTRLKNQVFGDLIFAALAHVARAVGADSEAAA